jgi:hypothetical protein
MKQYNVLVLLIIAIILSSPAILFSAELDGWAKGICWVTKEPSKKVSIVGFIKPGAVITVETTENNDWLKIVYAPVRNLKTMEYIECGGCFIQDETFTDTSPYRKFNR